MNSYSSYHSSSSSDILLKRFRLWKRQYLHVVIYTSLFWIFVDVFFIMLFSDCTKQVIIPCSIKENEINNNKLIDDEIPRHPKFNLNRIKEKNETILNRYNVLNRKKIEQGKKSDGGFIAKWFGSDSGLKNDLKEHEKNRDFFFKLKEQIHRIGRVKVVVRLLFHHIYVMKQKNALKKINLILLLRI
jgi:hypothetical protein